MVPRARSASTWTAISAPWASSGSSSAPDATSPSRSTSASPPSPTRWGASSSTAPTPASASRSGSTSRPNLAAADDDRIEIELVRRAGDRHAQRLHARLQRDAARDGRGAPGSAGRGERNVGGDVGAGEADPDRAIRAGGVVPDVDAVVAGGRNVDRRGNPFAGLEAGEDVLPLGAAGEVDVVGAVRHARVARREIVVGVALAAHGKVVV